MTVGVPQCSKQRASRLRPRRTGAFTLVELLVVITVISILASLLLPVLGRSKARAEGLSCLNNTRQLVLGWLMYADDSNGRLAYNLGGTSGRKIAPRTAPLNWVDGVLDWELTPDNTNTALLTAGSLASYVSQAVRVYRCPSDHALSDLQRRAGWSARVRSYSMNAMMGDAGDASRAGYNVNNPAYQQFFTLGSVPTPVDLFVFLDEHPDSINDGYFINRAYSWEWTDLPASYHDGAAGFSFADGHTELHRWIEPSTRVPARPDAAALPMRVPRDQRADFDWVSDRMSIPGGSVATPATTNP